MPGWRNWQTRGTQNPLAARPCGFKSRPGHQQKGERLAELLTLKELQKGNSHFVVPSYQRGYRWRREEIEELLNDLLEAHKNNKNYFLQPLFIAEDKETKKIIDGQQRLTTLYIILKALGVEPEFSIEYETRKGSEEFLQKIEKKDQKEADENPDYYFMWQAYETASSKLSKLCEDKKEKFKNFLSSMVHFLLYRVEKEKEIEVFVRLNSGRIPLTDAELIRAYLLKKDNFKGEEKEKERKQIEIGKEWETVEREFQEDSFFYFLSPEDYQTRMDLLFEVFLKKKKGTNYELFREFKKRLDSTKEVWELWQEVKKTFYTLKYWHRDDELYHTLGILFSTGEHHINFAKKVQGKKRSEMKREAMEELRKKLFGKEGEGIKITELSYGDQKVKLVLTIFNSAIYSKRGLRFPFHAFNREKWSIEHIHPQKDAEVKEGALKDWICEELNWLLKVRPESKRTLENRLSERGIKLTLSKEGVKLENCKKVLPSGNELENLKKELLKLVDEFFGNPDNLEFIKEDDKNFIGNLTLLTRKQNSKFSNHTFPLKREKLLKIEDEGEFVLLGTKEVFLKRYSDEKGLSHPFVWSNKDAEKYAETLEERIREFLGVKGGEGREKN